MPAPAAVKAKGKGSKAKAPAPRLERSASYYIPAAVPEWWDSLLAANPSTAAETRTWFAPLLRAAMGAADSDPCTYARTVAVARAWRSALVAGGDKHSAREASERAWFDSDPSSAMSQTPAP